MSDLIEKGPDLVKKTDVGSKGLRIHPGAKSRNHGRNLSSIADGAISIRPVEEQQSAQEVQDEIRRENEHARIRFDVDADSGNIVMNIVDPETSEVIKQLPPKNVFEKLRDQGIIKLKSFLVDVKR